MTTNGYECIIESIKLFESQLHTVVKNKTSVENLQSSFYLAKKSGYSLWHFIRLFSSTTGITPKAYISSRIFTECSKLLILPKEDIQYKSISFLASIFGFDTAANFSKGFKTWCGYTPASIRKSQNLNLLSSVLTEPLVVDVKTLNNIYEGEKLQAEIITRPALHLTGLSFYLDKPLYSFDTLWKTFESKSNKIKTQTPNQFIQYTAWNPSEDGSNSDGQMLVVCALTTEENVSQKPIFITRTIPEGKFLHVIHTGSMSTIGKTYQQIYGQFFANSELKLTSGWEYQLYRDDITDIFIPLF